MVLLRQLRYSKCEGKCKKARRACFPVMLWRDPTIVVVSAQQFVTSEMISAKSTDLGSLVNIQLGHRPKIPLALFAFVLDRVIHRVVRMVTLYMISQLEVSVEYLATVEMRADGPSRGSPLFGPRLPLDVIFCYTL